MGYDSDADSRLSLSSRPRLAGGGRARPACGGAVDPSAFLALHEECMRAKQRERAAELKMQQ